MLVNFEELSPESRIWIYQADRPLSDAEKQFIHEKSAIFLEGWKSHGKPVEAGIQIQHDRFIIIGLNDKKVELGGCAIDKLMRFMRKLGGELNTDLLDKSKIAIIDEVNIEQINFSEIKDLIANARISPDTRIFNNAIVYKRELESGWVLPAGESWLKRYF